MDKQLSEFREDFNSKLNHVETELMDLRSRICWIIGIQISTWITIIPTILCK